MKKWKVMMVEPDKFIRDIFDRKFNEAGFDFTGLDCAEADFLDKVENLKPDIISLGIFLYKHVGDETVSMPDGIEVIKSLKDDSRVAKIPVFFLTNQSSQETVKKAMSLGAEGYLITANITPSDMITTFSKYLNMSESEKKEFDINKKNELSKPQLVQPVKVSLFPKSQLFSKKIKKILVFIVCVVLIVFIYNFLKPDRWSLFYYPDGCLTCQDKHIIRHGYKSLDHCRGVADVIRNSRNSNPDDTYECGLNCRLEEKLGIYVCKETLD